jgi:hypothetical protein
MDCLRNHCGRLRVGVLLGLLLLGCAAAACSEATFRLADESALPSVFADLRVARSEVTAAVDYYVLPWGRKATFTVRRKSTAEILGKAVAQLDGLASKVLAETTNGYPSYEIARIESVVVVLEHRKPEPVVYICDDPKVLEALGVK